MANGWQAIGYDLNPQPDYPGEFRQANVLTLTAADLADADFVCASSPCEQFSVHCMKHFHPNPPYPELGIRLFEHTQAICEASGVPFIMENVRCAERFVGRSVNHCGPFYLWGNAVPAIMPKHVYELKKGLYLGTGQEFRANAKQELRQIRKRRNIDFFNRRDANGKQRSSVMAEIPRELAGYISERADNSSGKRDPATD